MRAIDGEIYDDMLAEQQDYAEIYGQLNQQQDETNQGNEQGRDQEPGEGGGEVLPTEQPVETGRDGVVEGERQAGGNVNRQDDGAQADASGEIKPIGKGPFGNIYDQFRGKAKEAIKFLLGKKGGEAVGALHHKDVGDIDLVWGKEGTGKSNGYGLSKLAKYHPEVLDNLQEIIDEMEISTQSSNRINLESKTHKAAVRLEWDGQRKNWLLTAFEKETPTSIDRTTDIDENPTDSQNDTAPLQNVDVSENKISENPGESQVGTTENVSNLKDNVTSPAQKIEDVGEKATSQMTGSQRAVYDSVVGRNPG